MQDNNAHKKHCNIGPEECHQENDDILRALCFCSAVKIGMRYLLFYKGRGKIVNIPENTTSEEYGQIQSDFAGESGEYADMYRLHETDTINGLYFLWELAGPGGARFIIIAWPTTGKEQIEKAKKAIKASRDVISLKVLRVKELF